MEIHSQTRNALPKSFAPLNEQNLDFSKIDDLMLVHGRHHELSDEQRSQLLANEQTFNNMKSLPSNPLDLSFYHVYDNTLPEEQYYRLIPEGKYQVTTRTYIVICISFIDSLHLFRNIEKDWCAESAEHVKSKSYKRRFIFEGWNNYTAFEK